MIQWDRNKHEINNGFEFNPGDDATVEQINGTINNALYSVDIADGLTELPEVENPNPEASPTVSFVDYVKEIEGVQKTLKKFKFTNIKGRKGERGLQGAQGIQGIPGADGRDGYAMLLCASEITETAGEISIVLSDEIVVPEDVAWDALNLPIGTLLQSITNGYIGLIEEADQNISPTLYAVRSAGLTMKGATGAQGIPGIKGDKGDKGDPGGLANISQGLGTSDNLVISQKVVTEELGKKADKSTVTTELNDIKGRLDRLGFKEGTVTVSSGTVSKDSYLRRQGNYVIGFISIENPGNNNETMRFSDGFYPDFDKFFKPDAPIKLLVFYGGSSTSENVLEPGMIAFREQTKDILFYPGNNIKLFTIFFGYEAKPL